MSQLPALSPTASPVAVPKTAFGILYAISAAHLLNDMMQSLIVALYPLLQPEFSLSYAQIGLITLTYQFTASLLQPLIGMYIDRHPQPRSLPIGMGFTLAGLVMLALAQSYPALLIAAALIGTGSSVFHPESSRVARMASGGRHGFAQSIFQIGGSIGSALGPLLAAVIIAPYGKGQVGWFVMAAMLAIVILLQVSRWYAAQHTSGNHTAKEHEVSSLPRSRVILGISILLVLIFSKFVYTASLSSYYTFYLINKFSLSVQQAQLYLFAYLVAAAAGTMIGGSVSDRFGRKKVIWCSILGSAPFSLALPELNLEMTCLFSIIIGLILSSAFSAIVVFAQELVPGRIGMISGLFFGFAFGMGGLGSAGLGLIADHAGINTVFRICSFLPLLGLMAIFLPGKASVD